MSEDHYLDAYLAEVLPSLGLDVEAYAPYVTGYANDDDEGDESLEDLIDLLRASSESHGEDEAVWQDFRNELIQRRQDFLSTEAARKEVEALEIYASTNAKLKEEIELAKKNALEVEEKKQREIEAQKVENMSGDKIALLAKYGYEDGDDDGAGDDDDGESGKLMTNREHAAAVSQQYSQKQRSTSTQTKAEARQETAKAKADKNAKKEERRKRAGKRERHR